MSDKKKRKSDSAAGVDGQPKARSWKRDEEEPNLLIPRTAFDDDNPEDEYREVKYRKRLEDFKGNLEKQKEAAKKRQDANPEYDDAAGLEFELKEDEEEEVHPVVERNFANDAIKFDYATGKTVITRPIKPRWFSNWNIFRPDDTVVLNGKRRTGKSYLMRNILYEMRHMFWGGLVFTATKHNGTASLVTVLARPAVLVVDLPLDGARRAHGPEAQRAPAVGVAIEALAVKHHRPPLRATVTRGLTPAGFWQQFVPRRYIHETLSVPVIENLLKIRAAQIDELQMKFGPEYRDQLYYFVVLDDMVDQKTRYYEVRVNALREGRPHASPPGPRATA